MKFAAAVAQCRSDLAVAYPPNIDCRQIAVVVYLFRDGNFDHFNWRLRAIASGCRCGFDRFDDIHARRNFAKNWVLRSARAEPIEERIVYGVHKKLCAAGIWCAGVGHRQRARLIRQLLRWRMLILHATEWRIALTRAWCIWIFGEFAAELHHEVFDHAVKVQAIVKAHLRKLDEVTGRHWHLIAIDLRRERAH